MAICDTAFANSAPVVGDELTAAPRWLVCHPSHLHGTVYRGIGTAIEDRQHAWIPSRRRSMEPDGLDALLDGNVYLWTTDVPLLKHIGATVELPLLPLPLPSVALEQPLPPNPRGRSGTSVDAQQVQQRQLAPSTDWRMPCHAQTRFLAPEDAQLALNVFAKDRGYAVVYAHTRYDKNDERQRIVYTCDRHGERRTQPSSASATPRQNAASRKCGCPMQVHVTRVSGRGGIGEVWEIEYRERAFVHNHPPSQWSSAHPIHRCASLTRENRQAIAVDAETAVRPRQTVAALRRDHPDLIITKRDIYNERQRQ